MQFGLTAHGRLSAIAVLQLASLTASLHPASLTSTSIRASDEQHIIGERSRHRVLMVSNDLADPN
eukprot:9522008-Alexandrium_andersonii.AAC.1